ncbi:MAG: PD40 domain-containing protein, partial [Desulfurococcales archaeon]|nr:PD40 domain-containing protein [Desulfurococcales archaeon]
MGKRKLTVDDILRITYIDEVRVSTKGDIALTVTRSDLGKNKVLTEVHILRSDGSSAFLVGEGDSLPRWSPSGRLLAFSSRRGASEKEKGSGIFVWSGVGEPRKLAWFKHGVS